MMVNPDTTDAHKLASWYQETGKSLCVLETGKSLCVLETGTSLYGLSYEQKGMIC